ncbi:MAG: class I SAM-dependent methyltransferase [Bdellovibrionales bacterium]|nr:class I SAM-dependent methyltransferase [Bdellovibrionales bacterium]
MRTPNKFYLYEQSVQSPEAHIELLAQICTEMGHSRARRMREDFCGTGALSCHWVAAHPENTAVGLDLDPEPLAYGKKVNVRALSQSQKRRVNLLRSDVLSPAKGSFDLVVAANFSFFIFKERITLLNYFKKVRSSLVRGGIFTLEMAGGPGMIARGRERRTISIPRVGKVVYTWHQRKFDAVTHDALYSIHFTLPDGRKMSHVFEYDWRLWTIPEVRDLLKEAGFSRSAVYWEKEDKHGRGTGEYECVKNGDNSFAWIAQVVGVN